MEFRKLLRILKKQWLFLLLATVLFAGIALVGSLQIPPLHRAQMTLYIKRSTQPASQEFFNYDGYYAQQAAERYTDTVAGLLREKSSVKDALGVLEVGVNQKILRQIYKRVEIKKVAPQLVRITARKRFDYEEVWKPQDLVAALAGRVQQSVRDLNKGGDEAFSVDVLNEEPLVEQNEPVVWLNMIVGGLLGLFFAFFVVAFKEYLRN